MALRDWVFNYEQVANAISARVAIPGPNDQGKLARIASIALAKEEKAEVPSPGKADHESDVISRLPKPQVSCRAFEITHILMVTRTEHCIEQQGEHCGDCRLRQQVAACQ